MWSLQTSFFLLISFYFDLEKINAFTTLRETLSVGCLSNLCLVCQQPSLPKLLACTKDSPEHFEGITLFNLQWSEEGDITAITLLLHTRQGKVRQMEWLLQGSHSLWELEMEFKHRSVGFQRDRKIFSVYNWHFCIFLKNHTAKVKGTRDQNYELLFKIWMHSRYIGRRGYYLIRKTVSVLVTLVFTEMFTERDILKAVKLCQSILK